MSGRTRTFTEKELEARTELTTPNFLTGEVYWLSNKYGKREFSPTPVRAHRAQEAARRAVGWIGGPVFVWTNDRDGGEIVWVEWPAVAMRPSGRSMLQFSYYP